MSIIADALRKVEGRSGPATGPGAPRPVWPYRLLLLGCAAAVAVGLARIARGPQQPPLPPTAQQVAAPQPAPLRGSWALQGIIRGGPGSSIALINDQVVQEGDPIGGKRVLRIEEASVLLQDEAGQAKTLRLVEE